MPTRNVELVDDGVIVTYYFNGYDIIESPIAPNTYLIKIPNFGINDVLGEPATLFRWDLFAIPQISSFSVELVDSAFSDTTLIISPAIEHTTELFNDNNDSISIIPYNGFFPKQLLYIDNSQNYNNYNLLNVCVQPIQYNYTNHCVRYFNYIKYKVSFDNEEEGLSFADADPIINNLALNFQVNSIGRRNNRQLNRDLSSYKNNRDYAIFSCQKYNNVVEDFANWKRTKGWRTHVFYADSVWSTTAIKSKIDSLHLALRDSLKHLLFIGDIEDIPSYIKTHRYSHATDLYYGCLEEGNYIPQIHRGRIPIKTSNEAIVVLNKIINYEQNPIIDSTFYKTGLHCAHFEGANGYESSRFVKTCEELRNTLLSNGYQINRVYTKSINPLFWNKGWYANGEAIPDSLRYPQYPWNGNKYDISQYINNGAFYVLHRDHGQIDGWSNPQFLVTDFHLLNNGNKQPVVFSINCLSGKFNDNNDSFAEALLKKENGGSVGVIAASIQSLKGYNDAFAEGMFDAIWPDYNIRPEFGQYNGNIETFVETPIYDLGTMLDQGMMRMQETFGSKDSNDMIYTREIFHCLGDPSMMIYTGVPQQFNTPILRCQDGKIIVQTIEDDTRITFFTPVNNTVDSYIGNYVEYSTTEDSVVICIDKHNYIPYIQMYKKDLYIQNETINGNHIYCGKNIKVGSNVTSTIPTGEVIINNANVTIEGENVILKPGTTIKHSNVIINKRE